MKASELAGALKDAHVRHACAQLETKKFWQDHLRSGIKTLGDQPLGTLVDADTLSGVVDDWLAQVDTAQGLEPVIRQVSQSVVDAAGDDPATVGELLNEQHFEAILELALRFQTLREKAIHAALNHPLVSEMVSEMLYTGIKNFLLEENALAKLPGVSSMMKLGRKSMGKAMGGLEDSIRDYLHHNTRSTLRAGETWLNRQLTNERIAELARDAYARVAHLKPADAIASAPDGIVGEITPHACAIADEGAHLEYSRRLVAVGVGAAVEALTEWSLAALLKAQDTTAPARIKILAPALAKGAAVLNERQLLQPWVEQALGDFYDSEACLGVLEEALK